MDIFRDPTMIEAALRKARADLQQGYDPFMAPRSFAEQIELWMMRVTDVLEEHWPFSFVAMGIWCGVAWPVYLGCAVLRACKAED